MRLSRAARRARCLGPVALLAFVLAGCTSGTTDPSTEPGAAPSSEPTPTEKNTEVDVVPRNGRVTTAERYLSGNARAYQWRAFDPVSETGLLAARGERDRADDFDGLRLVGLTGPVARLPCGRKLPCSREDSWLSYTATLGPAADEVTVGYGARAALVLDERGRVRWTLDLTPIHDFRGDVQKLAWSPDGSRLAIATHADIWLVEGDGDPQLASSPGRIWNLSGWSPDGQSLLVDQYAGQHAANVVVLHLATDGSPTMTEQTLYQSDRHFDWAGNLAWSPDGTRIAVRTSSSIVEISAEDGSVLARHPHLNGWLIWPARDHS